MSAATPLPVIALAGDDNYAPGLFVSLLSVLKHLKAGVAVEVVVFDEGLSPATRATLNAIVTALSPGSRLRIVAGFRESGVDAPVQGHMTTATYARLLVPQACADAELALYIDADTLTRGDLSPLLTMELGAHAAAAVIDSDASTFELRLTYGALDDIADLQAPYFNAGVMLMNLPVWREHGLADTVVSYIDRAGSQLRFMDQDAINMTLGGEIEPLDGRFNYQLRVERQRSRGTLPEQVTLIHFTHPVKPWASADWLFEDPLSRAASLAWWRVALLSRELPARFRVGMGLTLLRYGSRLLARKVRRRLVAIMGR